MTGARAMSKAGVVRFLEQHVGERFHTVQERPGHAPWCPGPRVLSKRGGAFLLGQSRMPDWLRDSSIALVAHDADRGIIVYRWDAADGTTIHTTTYTLIEENR